MIDRAELARIMTVLEKHDGNKTKAAEELNIPRSTLSSRLTAATRSAIGPHFQGPSLPSGLEVAGTTTLYKDGDAKLQWVRTKQEKNLRAIVAALQETFDEYNGKAVLPQYNPNTKENLLALYPIADLHLGMYSWDEETGANYDLNIASSLLKETVGSLIYLSPPAETAIVLNLGDFFHSDSNENRTRRSGNALDVDTRYAKVLRVGVELLIATVQMILTKHKRVIIRNLQGNHDPYAALALSLALKTYFSGSARVIVDDNPGPFWFYKHGKVLMGATHGDMAKAQDMPGIMAAKVPQDWGQTTYRYIYTGHLHSAKKALVREDAGAQVEVFQTLAPRDAWGNSMGFSAGRSMPAIILDKEQGEVCRLTVSVKGPE